MGSCQMDGPDSAAVQSPEEMVGRFHGELMTSLPGWKAQLSNGPDQLGNLEREVHAAFSRGADLVVVGLISAVMKQEAFDQACEQTRTGFAYPLGRGRIRAIRVRLLGGVLM